MNRFTIFGWISLLTLSMVQSSFGIIQFTNSCNVPYSGQITGLAAADFNGDTNLDILVTSQGGFQWSIADGDGQGRFYMTNTVSSSIAPSASCIAAGDVDGDGKIDVVLGTFSTDRVILVPGNGDGTFDDPNQSWFNVGSPTNVVGVALSDFNGDAELDIAAVSTNLVFLYSGNGDGTFVFTTNFPAGGNATCVTSADLNRDGAGDLLVGLSPEGEGVWLNNGDGSFGAPTYFTGTGGVGILRVSSAAAADYDGDSILDLAMTLSAGSPFPRIYNGIADGVFQSALPIAFVDSGGSGSSRVVSGDWNNDGKPDLVLAHNIKGLRMLLNETMPPVSIGGGDSVMVSWDAEFGKLYQLQSSSVLGSPNWSPINTNITRLGFRNVYTNSVFGEVRFFRLSKED